MTIYFTSDHHFGHQKIIEYCNRPFSSVSAMTDALIERWNDTVEDDDLVYIIGDFSFFNTLTTIRIVDELAGQKALICGNHDKLWYNSSLPPGRRRLFLTEMAQHFVSIFDGSRPIHATPPRADGSTFPVLMHHFPHRQSGWETKGEPCGVCEGVGSKMTTTGLMVRCHRCRGTGRSQPPDPYAEDRYAPGSWGELLLCGHVHDAWRTLDGIAVNVGVDVWDYRPVGIDEILDALMWDTEETEPDACLTS